MNRPMERVDATRDRWVSVLIDLVHRCLQQSGAESLRDYLPLCECVGAGAAGRMGEWSHAATALGPFSACDMDTLPDVLHARADAHARVCASARLRHALMGHASLAAASALATGPPTAFFSGLGTLAKQCTPPAATNNNNNDPGVLQRVARVLHRLEERQLRLAREGAMPAPSAPSPLVPVGSGRHGGEVVLARLFAAGSLQALRSRWLLDECVRFAPNARTRSALLSVSSPVRPPSGKQAVVPSWDVVAVRACISQHDARPLLQADEERVRIACACVQALLAQSSRDPWVLEPNRDIRILVAFVCCHLTGAMRPELRAPLLTRLEAHGAELTRLFALASCAWERFRQTEPRRQPPTVSGTHLLHACGSHYAAHIWKARRLQLDAHTVARAHQALVASNALDAANPALPPVCAYFLALIRPRDTDSAHVRVAKCGLLMTCLEYAHAPPTGDERAEHPLRNNTPARWLTDAADAYNRNMHSLYQTCREAIHLQIDTEEIRRLYS